MRLISKCPICNKKNTAAVKVTKIGKSRFITLDCGHSYSEKGIEESQFDELILADGRKLYPFQNEGVKFIERSNFRCQISDEMGLGKTIQAIGAINLHYDDLKPILIVVKASLTFNWFKETVKGAGKLAQVFESGDKILPGVGIVIVSYDTLIPRKVRGSEFEVNNENFETIKAFQPRTVILDEVQSIKNHNSKRTNAIRELIRTRIPKAIKIEPSTLNQRPKIEMIANDLMNYHGLTNRFSLKFSTLKPGILGYCECKKVDEGIVKGEIVINRSHAEHDNESEVIETILHEISHAITPGAGHRRIWSECCKSIGGNGEAFAWCNGTREPDDSEDMVKYIISLSGTPIKNNAIEYFPILNLLHPEMFPTLDYFERNYVEYYYTGTSYKPAGLKYPEDFKQRTRDFIIRRTRDEVMPDLPKIVRNFKYYPMGDIVRKEYNKKVKGLQVFLNDNIESQKSDFYTDLMSYLSILRHITGLAKVEPTLEYVNEFIENGGMKIVLFHHHIDVGDVICAKLDNLGIKYVRITSNDSSETRLDKIEQFRGTHIEVNLNANTGKSVTVTETPINSDIQVLIAPTLACGEGINLQFCSNAILLEREWNPANEEQVEGRFSRIGSVSNSIDVCYPTAIETIDEYFAEIVERKRQYVNSSLDGNAIEWNQSQIMVELAEKVVKKWKF